MTCLSLHLTGFVPPCGVCVRGVQANSNNRFSHVAGVVYQVTARSKLVGRSCAECPYILHQRICLFCAKRTRGTAMILGNIPYSARRCTLACCRYWSIHDPPGQARQILSCLAFHLPPNVYSRTASCSTSASCTPTHPTAFLFGLRPPGPGRSFRRRGEEIHNTNCLAGSISFRQFLAIELSAGFVDDLKGCLGSLYTISGTAIVYII